MKGSEKFPRYYRFRQKFHPNFADAARPLNNLTSDNVLFVWDDSCESVFTELKRLLSTYPVLAFPRLSEPFVVDVDASNVAFGGVAEGYRPSRHDWAPMTKEAFSLLLTLRHWYVYLSGTEFILNLDHNPLMYLRSQKDPRGKFSRWILELEEFNYVVK